MQSKAGRGERRKGANLPVSGMGVGWKRECCGTI